MGTVLAVVAGNTVGVWLLVLVAVLSGQLSIGWSNDLLDAERDSGAGRTDKPFAAGEVGRALMVGATSAACVLTVLASFALGWRAAAAQLAIVLCGWLYNLGLKSSLLSPVLYAVAFGALPAVATLARPDHPWPMWWVVATGSLLGIAAHFGNVLPDLDEDLAAGVRGVPHRVGRLGSAVVAAAAVTVGTGLVLLLPVRPPDVLGWGLTALAVVLAASIVLVTVRGRRLELAFLATMAAAAVCLVLLATADSLP